MISDTTFGAIAPLLHEVNGRNIILRDVEDSALQIVKNSGLLPNVNLEQINDEEFITAYKKALDTPLMSGVMPGIISMGNGMVPVREHEETLQHVNDININLVNGIIDRARNKIQPFIVNVCKAATEIPNNSEHLEILFDIRNTEHFAGWRSDWVIRILEQFQVNPVDWSRGVSLVLPTAPDVLPRTGNNSFDELLEAFLSEYAMTVKDVFPVLQGEMVHPGSIEASDIFDRVMFTFLLLCSCEQDPWEGTGMSLDQYRLNVAETNNKLAAWLKEYMQITAADADSDLLIRGIKQVDLVTRVYTNPITYARFIESGGTAETIYGMLMMTRGGDNSKYFVHTPKVLEHQNHYLEIWDEKITIDRTKNSQEWLEGVRTAIFRAFNHELLAADDDVLPAGLSVEEALSTFKAFVKTEVQLYNINEIDTLLMDGLKRHIFKGEMTIDLLRLIDMYMKEGMSDSEAQRQATLDIIFEWVSSQFYVAE